LADDPTLINDERFARPVCSRPNQRPISFVLHALSYRPAKRRAAIVCFGIFIAAADRKSASTGGQQLRRE
jgi:hypothetical protein